MARNLRDVIGTIGTLDVRLASWRDSVNEVYQRRYVPVKPEDRFVSGQQFEFTADLEFRDWVIDDFSGGIANVVNPDTYAWNPTDGRVRQMQNFFGTSEGPARRALDNDITTTDGGGSPEMDDSHVFFGYGFSLWTGVSDNVYQWLSSGQWDASAVSTGAGVSDEIRSVANPGNGSVYVSLNSKEIRKMDDLTGTPVNSTHVANTVFNNIPLLVAFNGRLFSTGRENLWEIDLTTTDTRTKVTDIGVDSTWISFGDETEWERITTSDVGPIWWVRTDSGRVDVWEYNVGSDTADKISTLPYEGAYPHGIYWAFGFTFVSYSMPVGDGATSHFFIYYFRGSQSGTIGPLINGSGFGTYATNAETPLRFAGVIGDVLYMVQRDTVIGYDFGDGALGVYGDLYNGVSVGASARGDGRATVWGDDLFVGDVTDDGSETNRCIRLSSRSGLSNRGLTSVLNPKLRTGRWHFGYPNVEKIFTEITVETYGQMLTGDSLQLTYYTDDGIVISSGTTEGTTMDGNTSAPPLAFTWIISDNTNTRRGYYLDIEIEQTADLATNTSPWGVSAIRARATSSQSRREWQLVLDASDSSSAGFQQDDVTFFQALETLKTNKAVVQFTDPWQQKDEGTADTYDVIVEDVVTPAATHSGDDRREAFVILREVELV